MKKIRKHIEKLHFVKVYIADKNEQALTHFEGIIFDSNEDFLFMCDLSDFNYDGFVILRKKEITDIKRSENEKFFNRILKEEQMIRTIEKRKKKLDFELGEMEDMFRQLKKMKIAAIVECLYNSEESFQIGPVVKCKEKKMKIDYFNSRGEYELEPVTIKYKDITFFRIDSPYANLFFKYSERPEHDGEKKGKKPKKKKKVDNTISTKKKVKKETNKLDKSKKSTEMDDVKNNKPAKKSKKKKYEKPKKVTRLMLVV